MVESQVGEGINILVSIAAMADWFTAAGAFPKRTALPPFKPAGQSEDQMGRMHK